MSPEFLEFLKCLDPTADSDLSLCAKLEKTLFGCYVTDSESDESELSGFLSNKDSDEPSPSVHADSNSRSTPSRFTWRNSVSLP